jgi:adenosine deaminase
MDLPVDETFTQALPKVELHAHLSGSISRATLHKIWQDKTSTAKDDNEIQLVDPAVALIPAGTFPTIISFFQIFNDYIYNLVNDQESIAYATRAVIEDFQRDGVRYLELRTTPRSIPGAGISREEYVKIVLEALSQYHKAQLNSGANDTDLIEVHLILSIDRTMTASEADEIVNLVAKYSQSSPVPTSTPKSRRNRPLRQPNQRRRLSLHALFPPRENPQSQKHSPLRRSSRLKHRSRTHNSPLLASRPSRPRN